MTGFALLADGTFGLLIPVGVFALFVVIVALVLRSVTVVQPYERYVVTDGDTAETVLEEGVHVTSPFAGDAERIDLRTQSMENTVEGVPTNDGVGVTVTVTEEIRVTDPVAAVTGTADYSLSTRPSLTDHQAAVSERTRDVLVSRIERRRWDELDGAAADLASACADDLASDFEQWGVELVEFEVDGIERAT